MNFGLSLDFGFSKDFKYDTGIFNLRKSSFDGRKNLPGQRTNDAFSIKKIKKVYMKEN